MSHKISGLKPTGKEKRKPVAAQAATAFQLQPKSLNRTRRQSFAHDNFEDSDDDELKTIAIEDGMFATRNTAFGQTLGQSLTQFQSGSYNLDGFNNKAHGELDKDDLTNGLEKQDQCWVCEGWVQANF